MKDSTGTTKSEKFPYVEKIGLLLSCCQCMSQKLSEFGFKDLSSLLKRRKSFLAVGKAITINGGISLCSFASRAPEKNKRIKEFKRVLVNFLVGCNFEGQLKDLSN